MQKTIRWTCLTSAPYTKHFLAVVAAYREDLQAPVLDALNFLKDKTLDYFEHNLTGLQPQPEIAREFAKRHKKDPNKIAFYEREIVYLGDQYFVGFYVIEAEEPLETKQYILARNLLSSKRNVLVDTSLG